MSLKETLIAAEFPCGARRRRPGINNQAVTTACLSRQVTDFAARRVRISIMRGLACMDAGGRAAPACHGQVWHESRDKSRRDLPARGRQVQGLFQETQMVILPCRPWRAGASA